MDTLKGSDANLKSLLITSMQTAVKQGHVTQAKLHYLLSREYPSTENIVQQKTFPSREYSPAENIVQKKMFPGSKKNQKKFSAENTVQWRILFKRKYSAENIGQQTYLLEKNA